MNNVESLQKIYVKFEIPKTVKRFVELFFNVDNPPKYKAYQTVQTFRDSKCSINQCYPDRSRSIEDLYLCVKTYFPDASLKEVMEILLKLRPQGNFLSPSYCCTINRPVIAFGTWKKDRISNRITKNPYTWGSALSLLGIKNATDFYNYIGV